MDGDGGSRKDSYLDPSQEKIQLDEEEKNSGNLLQVKSMSVESAITARQAFNENQSVVSLNTKLKRGQFYKRKKLTPKHVL